MFPWKFWKAQQLMGGKTSQYKEDNPVPALLQIALICNVKGDGDALYSE